MNITLTPELEELIERKVKSGRFNSAGEVVREGLYLLDLEDDFQELKKERLREEILKADEQFKNGQFITITSEEEMSDFLEGIIERGKKRLAEEKAK